MEQRSDSLKKQWPNGLKLVFTKFLVVCFLSLKESTCETGKNVSYFTLKAPFILVKIKF